MAMRSINTIFGIVVVCLTARGQEGYYPFPPLVLSASDINSGVEIYQVGQEIRYSSSEPFRIYNSANVEMISGTQVRINGNFKASDFAVGGRFHAKIAPPPFAVAIASPDLTNGTLGRYEKLEIAIRPNDEILNRIQTFIEYSNSHTDSEAFYMNITPGTYQNNGWLASGGINPFMEWEIKVTGEFIALDDSYNPIYSKIVDGFYYFECPRLIGESGVVVGWNPQASEMPFRIRTVLDRVGHWKCRFKIEVPSMTTQVSDWYFLDVENEGHHGFVDVTPNGRFRSLDGGTFFPMGHNQMTVSCRENAPYNCSGDPGYGWFGAIQYPEAFANFDSYMDERINEGLRYFRFIMNPSGIDIEYERLGNYLGHMYPSQGNPNSPNISVRNSRYKYQIYAAEFDRVLDWADQRDVFIHLILHLGNSFKEYAPYADRGFDWLPHNLSSSKDDQGVRTPYLDHNTGYCYSTITGVEHPVDMLSSSEAWKYYQQRLRYQISRWGYSTQIAEMDIQSEIAEFGIESIAEYQGQYSDEPVVVYEPYTGRRFNIVSTNGTDDGSLWDKVTVLPLTPLGDLVAQWQDKIANYIKNVLNHKDHLVGTSYASHYMVPEANMALPSSPILANEHGDWSFRSPHIDVVSLNFYEHANSRPSRYYHFGEHIQKVQLNMLNTMGQLKPIVVGETNGGGDNGVENCDQDIEWRRAVYASPFTGIAGGAMNWNNQDMARPYLMNHLRYMSHFMDQIDLVNENWSFDRCQGTGTDRRAEFIYMRSADKTRAFGLLTNRTANFYTYGLPHPIDAWGNENLNEASNCVTFDPLLYDWHRDTVQFNLLQDIIGLNSGELLLSGLNVETLYDLTYFNPNFYQNYPGTPFIGPISVESGSDGSLTVPLLNAVGNPILTETDPFMLVEVKIHDSQFLGRYGSNELFKNDQRTQATSDDFEVYETSLDRIPRYKLFPNPVDGELIIISRSNAGNCEISLIDNIGQIVYHWPLMQVADGQTRLELPNIAPGLYHLSCTDFQGNFYRFKFIKK